MQAADGAPVSYCTSADFDIPERKIVQLCDDEATATATTTIAAAAALNASITTRITNAIARADSEIDAYLRSRYAVPIATTVPESIKQLSVDLALYYLHGRRDSEFGIPDSIGTRHEMAIRKLEGMADARIDLGIEPPSPASSKEVAYAEGPERAFTADTLDSF